VIPILRKEGGGKLLGDAAARTVRLECLLVSNASFILVFAHGQFLQATRLIEVFPTLDDLVAFSPVIKHHCVKYCLPE
jgi:hypothetical protein